MATDRDRYGEHGRQLRERGEALAVELFGRPLCELTRREMTTLLEHLAAG